MPSETQSFQRPATLKRGRNLPKPVRRPPLTAHMSSLQPLAAALQVVTSQAGGRDLSARELALLLAAARQQWGVEWGVREAAVELGLSKPAVTRAAIKLADMGWLQRSSTETDRRLTLMSTTAEGVKFLVRLSSAMTRAAPIAAAEG